MATICELNQKPEFSYPNLWTYRVIMETEQKAEAKIEEKLSGYEKKIEFSKHSSGGKYMSFEARVMVKSEKDRDEVFEKLKEISKFVL
ncbi:MAG: DUF493 domain-containing protein [Campylobacteraceae bacterium]|nr:DUF493 domain-containing protein [Campylobacteraceae bacterium]